MTRFVAYTQGSIDSDVTVSGIVIQNNVIQNKYVPLPLS